MKESIVRLRALEKQRFAYRYALNVVDFDAETVAPEGSADGRAEACEVLSRADFDLLVNDDTAALLRQAAQDAETEPVVRTVSGGDAMQLSALLIAFDYTAGATDVVYPYAVDLGEAKYSLRLVWKDNAWSCTAEYDGKTSALNTRSASIIAALLGVAMNGIPFFYRKVEMPNMNKER